MMIVIFSDPSKEKVFVQMKEMVYDMNILVIVATGRKKDILVNGGIYAKDK